MVRFWTRDKVAKAIPRDFGFDPVTRKFQPVRKPAPVAPSDQWTIGGKVAETTGRVLFVMGGTYYVCSASVVDDTLTDQSIILTAAHCVYDESTKKFATNWMFIPSYDSDDPSVTDVSVCSNSDYGCWTASALVVDREYADAGGFNTQATLHDFAFAVVGQGGKDQTQLDTAVGSQPINTNTSTPPQSGSDTYLFGYPLASPYDGNKDLRYSHGPLYTDPLNSHSTYRVSSLMTGGASGGPWFNLFDPTNDPDTAAPAFGEGTMISVNSYGYTRNSRLTTYDDTKMMYGPKFNAETASLYDLATTADISTISNS